MGRVVVLSFSEISRDPRVLRQIEWLSGTGHEITVVGYGAFSDPRCRFVRLEKPKARPTLGQRLLAAWHVLRLLFSRDAAEAAYWSKERFQIAERTLDSLDCDLAIANDIDSLPVMLRAFGKKARYLLDAHEFKVGQVSGNLALALKLMPRFWDSICQRYVPLADGFITVCQGIADLYSSLYGAKEPLVITNAPSFQPLTPSTMVPGKIRLVHHGLAFPGRELEKMISIVNKAEERFSLSFYLVAPDARCREYIEELKTLAGSRIEFFDPVPTREIAKTINRYDAGFYLLPPINLNHRLALPNKIFEFIQARLATIIGPSPEMARIVKRYDCGVVAPSFSEDDMLSTLRALTEQDVQRYKGATETAAARENAEENGPAFLKLVERLLATKS
jgi:hypothetical protein